MSCNERTALLAAQQGQQPHIVVVVPARSKDPKDYQPIPATADCSYSLTLEELLPYKDDPWWQALRRLCLGCFWLTFTLTLLAAFGLAYVQHDGAAAAACHANKAITGVTDLLPTAPTAASSLAATSNATLLLLAI